MRFQEMCISVSCRSIILPTVHTGILRYRGEYPARNMQKLFILQKSWVLRMAGFRKWSLPRTIARIFMLKNHSRTQMNFEYTISSEEGYRLRLVKANRIFLPLGLSFLLTFSRKVSRSFLGLMDLSAMLLFLSLSNSFRIHIITRFQA